MYNFIGHINVLWVWVWVWVLLILTTALWSYSIYPNYCSLVQDDHTDHCYVTMFWLYRPLPTFRSCSNWHICHLDWIYLTLPHFIILFSTLIMKLMYTVFMMTEFIEDDSSFSIWHGCEQQGARLLCIPAEQLSDHQHRHPVSGARRPKNKRLTAEVCTTGHRNHH